jgi:hypothetical protein
MEGSLAEGQFIRCPSPDTCPTCRFDRQWKATCPGHPYPAYVVQMLAQARIRAVLKGSLEIMQVCEIFDRKDRGIVISRYADPIQVTHVKDYVFAPRDALLLYAASDELVKKLVYALDHDSYNEETHFLFALIIETPNKLEETYLSVFPVSKYADRHVNLAAAQQTATAIEPTGCLSVQKHPVQSLADMLASVRWCCQNHILNGHTAPPHSATIDSKTCPTTLDASQSLTKDAVSIGHQNVDDDVEAGGGTSDDMLESEDDGHDSEACGEQEISCAEEEGGSGEEEDDNQQDAHPDELNDRASPDNHSDNTMKLQNSIHLPLYA